MRERNLALTPELTAAIREFCERNHVSKLALFGSVLRDDFRSDSDIDVLIDFPFEHIPGYLGLARMQRELTEIIGRKVDLRTPRALSRYFRDAVVDGAEVLYAA